MAASRAERRGAVLKVVASQVEEMMEADTRGAILVVAMAMAATEEVETEEVGVEVVATEHNPGEEGVVSEEEAFVEVDLTVVVMVGRGIWAMAVRGAATMV